MPIIKSAKKKMRQDKKRTILNRAKKLNLKAIIKKARQVNNDANLKELFSALDKAVKTNLIHKNRAARLKSRISKKSDSEATSTTTKAAPKKSVKKPAKKAAK